MHSNQENSTKEILALWWKIIQKNEKLALKIRLVESENITIKDSGIYPEPMLLPLILGKADTGAVIFRLTDNAEDGCQKIIIRGKDEIIYRPEKNDFLVKYGQTEDERSFSFGPEDDDVIDMIFSTVLQKTQKE